MGEPTVKSAGFPEPRAPVSYQWAKPGYYMLSLLGCPIFKENVLGEVLGT